MNEDDILGERRVPCHVFWARYAEVRTGKLRNFQFPSHPALTLHHVLLPCMSVAATPHSPQLLYSAPPLALLMPAASAAWGLQGWLPWVPQGQTGSCLPPRSTA